MPPQVETSALEGKEVPVVRAWCMRVRSGVAEKGKGSYKAVCVSSKGGEKVQNKTWRGEVRTLYTINYFDLYPKNSRWENNGPVL